MKTLMVGCAFAAAVLSGCGGGSGPGADEFDVAVCEEELEGLLDALSEIDSRLDIGMALDEYGDRLGDVSVAYDQVDFEDLEEGCRGQVASPAEEALNVYVTAHQRWDKCVFDQPNCELSDIELKLQGWWAEASLELEDAHDELEN